MILIRDSSAPGQSTSRAPSSSFTGEVWMDRAHRDEHISIVTVMFTPCARTNWHTHEKGQFLRVVAGSGWVCDKGGDPQRLNVGDVVWCPPGTTHWHGADDGSYMVHMAVSHGKVDWLQPVTDEEYNKKG